jgi:NAD(P)-dependent dehydrogenase (short-subunit alcohol dehydrogenase family)
MLRGKTDKTTTTRRQKTVVVTGAANGIGRAVARTFLDTGHKVAVLDIDKDALVAAFGEDKDAVKIVTDLSEVEPAEIAETVLEHLGPPDVIINNVNILANKSFLELEPNEFDKTFTVNLRTPWFMTKRLVWEMIGIEKRGSVLFISSLHDTFVRLSPDYSASQAAVSMLVKELAVELAQHGIRVNSLSPGAINSMSDLAGADLAQVGRMNNLVPLGRMGRPEDVAKLALMISDDGVAGYMNGVNIEVDGGLRLHNWLNDLAVKPEEPAHEEPPKHRGRRSR